MPRISPFAIPLALALALAVALAACGDGGSHAHHDATVDATSDAIADGTSDATGPDADADAIADGTGPDAAPDTVDATPDTTGPRTCDADEACNTDLDPQGVCPGACFPVPGTFGCRGEVVDGTCRRAPAIDPPPTVIDTGTLKVELVAGPTDVTVGDSADLKVRVTNETDATAHLPFDARSPDTWTISNASWDGITAYDIGPRTSILLTATVTAQQATTLTPYTPPVASISIGDVLFEPTATVHFAATEAVACGGEHFPATWCPDATSCYQTHDDYGSAECCGDVFYPGAVCCDDADCPTGGICADGKCVTNIPGITSSNTVAVGNQTILLVLVDTNPELADDPCADRYDQMKDTLPLAVVDGYYHDLAMRRFGRPTMAIRWQVRGGVATSDFLLPTDGIDWATYSQKLDAWYQERGCPMFGVTDKVIIASQTIDLQGFGGIYFDQGHIAVHDTSNGYLLAHELGHSWGATDTYLDLGGTFQYALDLMGNYLGSDPIPADDVSWAELGYSDTERDGVIDLAQFAAFPETLEIADAHATLDEGRQAVELHLRLGGREGGALKEVVEWQVHVDLPATPGLGTDLYGSQRDKVVTFDGTQIDLDPIRQSHSIDVHVTASIAFTDAQWQRQTRTLDTTVTVPVDIVAAP